MLRIVAAIFMCICIAVIIGSVAWEVYQMEKDQDKDE